MPEVEIPDTPVGDRLRWFLDGVRDETSDVGTMLEGFSETMAAGVPRAQVPTMLEQTRGMLGALEVQFMDAPSPVALSTELVRADGAGLKFDLVVEAESPHRITKFLVAPVGALRDPLAAIGDLPSRDVRSRSDDGFDEELAAEVVDAIGAFVATGQVGVAAAVMVDGRTWSAEAGLASVEAGRRVLPDTVFRAYSISKTVSTAALLTLVDEGLLGLDDAVADRLTSYRIVPPAGSEGPTIRQVLTHTAGIPSNFEHWVEQVGPVASVLAEEWRCDTTPGTAWAYSNAGFATIGQIIEDVTRRPFEDVVAERVLRPLGMERSEYRRTNAVGDSWAVGYDVRRGMVAAAETTVPSVLAAGSLFTTASELLRFVAASATDGAGVIPQALLDEGFRSQLEGSPVSPPGIAGQGLAWMLVDIDDRRWATHGGGGHGFSTMAAVLPGSGAGAVVLTNIGGQALASVSTAIQRAVQRRVG